jgi:hypothetical protein
MYLVQRFEFSPLINKSFQSLGESSNAFAAPFVLLILLLQEVLKKIQETGISFAEAIKGVLGSAVQSVKYTKLGGARGGSSIILLDPSAET